MRLILIALLFTSGCGYKLVKDVGPALIDDGYSPAVGLYVQLAGEESKISKSAKAAGWLAAGAAIYGVGEKNLWGGNGGRQDGSTVVDDSRGNCNNDFSGSEFKGEFTIHQDCSDGDQRKETLTQ